MSANPELTTTLPDHHLAIRYHECEQIEKIILQLLTLSFSPLRQKVILPALELIFTNSESGSKIPQNIFRNTLNTLVKKGLLTKDTTGCHVSDNLRPLILVDLVTGGILGKIGTTLQILLPPFSKKSYQRPSDEYYYRALRDLTITIFATGDKKRIHAALDEIIEIFQTDSCILGEIFNQPFTPELINLVARKPRAFILNFMLVEMGLMLTPARHVVDYIYNNDLAGECDPVFLALGLMDFGLFEKALNILGRVPADHKNFFKVPAFTARIALLRGDTKAALSGYRESLQLFKKKSGSRKIYLPDDTDSLYHLCAMLKSNDQEIFREALTYLANTSKKDSRYCLYYNTFYRIFMELTGEDPDKDYLFTKHIHYHHSQTELFLKFLFIRWVEPDHLVASCEDIVKIQHDALECEHHWLAAECAQLLVKLDYEKEFNLECGTQLHQHCGTVTMVNLYTPLPEWEKTLNYLTAINSPTPVSRQTTTNTDKRLIWLFDYHANHHTCNIYPRIQKRTKSGTWTQGRAAALKTLYREINEMDFLTTKDKAVIRSIREVRYGYYNSAEFIFELDHALPELIGHPLLFLDEQPDIKIELVPGKAELTIEKAGEKEFLLRIEPYTPLITPEILVNEITPTRFAVIEVTAKLKKLYELIDEELYLPRLAEEKIRTSAVALSGLVTIHSDLGGDLSIKEVPGDPRPHIHLLPYQNGISLSFRVKPFSDSETSFRPGSGGALVMAEVNKEKVQARRKLDRENKLVKQVVSLCPNLKRQDKNSDAEWLIEDPETALEILLELKNPAEKKEVFLEWPQGEKLKIRQEISNDNFSLQIKHENDWFKAGGKLKIDKKLTLDLKQIIEAMEKAKGRFLALDDNTFIALTDSLRKKIKELATYSEPVGNKLRFSPLARLAMSDPAAGLKNFSADTAWLKQEKRLTEIITPKVPSTFQAKLRDYQVLGFNWLSQLSHWQIGACLADDMGLGKTIQALAVILTRAVKGPTLVVAPLSVAANWEEECRRFAPTLKPLTFGSGDRRKMLDQAGPFDLIITSYGLFQVESKNLQKVKWQTVVLDEAQAIKNMQSKRSKAAMELQAEFKLITTGTPVENHLGELWTLFNFINPGLLGSFKWFQERFAVPIEKNRDQQANLNLKKLIQPFILRRLKSEVLQELPAKTEITLKVEMSPEEASLYEAQRLKSLADLEDKGNELPGHIKILVEIMKLRRLCCNPRLLLPETSIPSSKLKVFADTVKELIENRHKALVFSQFVGHLSLIREYLDKENISYQYLDGSTPVKKRKQSINDFQNGNGDLFLISLKAGGSGLNLTAADYVIHMDPWWNPAVEDQASDRAHRIGQTRPVTIYRIVTGDTIEERIIELHRHKRDLAENLLADSDRAGKLDAKELMQLLKR